MDKIASVLEIIGSSAGFLLMFTMFYQIVVGLFGFKKSTKDYADHDPEARFLVLIPAHNEEKYVERCIKSINCHTLNEIKA